MLLVRVLLLGVVAHVCALVVPQSSAGSSSTLRTNVAKLAGLSLQPPADMNASSRRIAPSAVAAVPQSKKHGALRPQTRRNQTAPAAQLADLQKPASLALWPSLRCITVLTVFFFFVYLSVVCLRLLRYFCRGNLQLRLKVCEYFIADATEALALAPALSVVMIGARLRSIQLDPMRGDPQGWAVACMYVGTSAFFLRFFLSLALYGLRRSPGILRQVCQASFCIASIMLYGCCAAIVASIFTMKAEGAGKVPAIPVMLHCLAVLVMAYLVEYSLLEALGALRQMQQEEASREAAKKDANGRGVGATEAASHSRSQEALHKFMEALAERQSNARERLFAESVSLQFPLMLCIVLVGITLRSVQLNLEPQVWGCVAMYATTGIVVVQAAWAGAAAAARLRLGTRPEASPGGPGAVEDFNFFEWRQHCDHSLQLWPGDGSQIEDCPGDYIVAWEVLQVYEEFSRGSKQIARLVKDTRIEVLEVADVTDEGRVRAKIKHPVGWISLRQGSHRFAIKVAPGGPDAAAGVGVSRPQEPREGLGAALVALWACLMAFLYLGTALILASSFAMEVSASDATNASSLLLGKQQQRQQVLSPPLSTAMQCVTLLTAVYFGSYLCLMLGGIFHGEVRKWAVRALGGVQRSLVFAPMLCVMMLSVRLRSVALHRSDPQNWARTTMWIAAWAVICQVVISLCPSCDPGARTASGIHPELEQHICGKLLTICLIGLRQVAAAVLYVAVALLIIALLVMQPLA